MDCVVASPPELKFLMFENDSNSCWLDASMALIAHNKTFKMLVGDDPNSKLHDIISKYAETVSILNDNSNQAIELRINEAKGKLKELQNSTHEYLEPKLKSKKGKPDSAFNALLNLIPESKIIKESLSITWLWRQKCLMCNTSKLTQWSKPIITLSKVNYFMPDCPSSIYLCSCNTEQEMKLIYKELPPCVFFHFENGAGKGESPPLFFSIQDRKYQLTGVITLEKGEESAVNHFITWIRHPKSNKWLECNDLNLDIISFTSEIPLIDLKDVYMYVYESTDKLGKKSIEISAEYTQLLQDFENTNVELIDLSDESEDSKSSAVSVSEQITKSFKGSTENIPNQFSDKEEKIDEKLDLATEKQNKELDASEEKKTHKLEIPKALDMLKAAATRELNKSDNKKITFKTIKNLNNSGDSINVKSLPVTNPDNMNRCTNKLVKNDSIETSQSKVGGDNNPKIDYTKAIIRNVFDKDSINVKSVPVTNPDNMNRSTNKLVKNDSIKTSQSKVGGKIDYAKAIIRNVIDKERTPIFNFKRKASMTSVLWQRRENRAFDYERRSTGSKESHLTSNSEENKSIGGKKSTVASSSEKLGNQQIDISCDKSALVINVKKHDCLVDDLNSIHEKKMTIHSDTRYEEKQDEQTISNSSENLPEICKNFSVLPKDNSKMKTCQTDSDEKNLFKMHKKFSIFSKGINKTETLEHGENGTQIAEQYLINRSYKCIDNHNSYPAKLCNERKRKLSTEQDMYDSSVQDSSVSSKIFKKFQKVDSDKNSLNDIAGSSEKVRTSSRKPNKNKKYITDYYDPSLIPLPFEKKKTEAKVTAVKGRLSLKDKMTVQNHKQLPKKKSAIKPGEILDERQIKKIINVHVDRAMVSFFEQVLYRKGVPM